MIQQKQNFKNNQKLFNKNQEADLLSSLSLKEGIVDINADQHLLLTHNSNFNSSQIIIPSSTLLLIMIQLGQKGIKNLFYSPKSIKFWSLAIKSNSLLAQYKPDTLKKLWIKLVKTKHINVIDDFIREKKTIIDRKKLKLHQLINKITAMDFNSDYSNDNPSTRLKTFIDSISYNEKVVFYILNQVLSTFIEEFPLFSTREILNAYKKNSMNIQNTYYYLKNLYKQNIQGILICI